METEFKETELGMIPIDWEIKKLGEVANILTGFPFPSKEYLSETGINVVRGENLSERNLKWNITKKWGKIDYKIEKYLITENVCLVSMDGNVGKNKSIVKKTDLPLLLAQRVASITSNKNNSQDFINQLILSDLFLSYCQKIKTGSVISHISKGQIENFVIPVPPLEEQKAIAKILSDLDEKIEINRKINENLEELGQTLFREWFIDFEFPNEKREPYKSSGGEMVESELGEIPKGWKVEKLGNYIKFIKGKKPISTSNEKKENYLQQILIDTFNGGVKIYADKTNTIIVDIENILMVMDGASSGRVEIGYEGILGSTLAKVDTTNWLNYYTYFYLKNKEEEINNNTTGTSIPHTDKGRINNFIIFISNKDLYFEFNKEVNSIINKIINSKKEIQSLQQIRDILLPKLMSGQIRVN